MVYLRTIQLLSYTVELIIWVLIFSIKILLIIRHIVNLRVFFGIFQCLGEAIFKFGRVFKLQVRMLSRTNGCRILYFLQNLLLLQLYSECLILLLLELCIEVAELHSHHQIQNEESAYDDYQDEYYVVADCARRTPNFIHDISPALHRDYNEDIQHALEYVIEASHFEVRVTHMLTSPIAWARIINFTKVVITIVSLLNIATIINTPVLQETPKQLSHYSSKHDQEEREEHEDIEKSGQRIQQRLDQSAHTRHRVYSTQGTQYTNNSDRIYIIGCYNFRDPTHYNHNEIQLY